MFDLFEYETPDTLIHSIYTSYHVATGVRGVSAVRMSQCGHAGQARADGHQARSLTLAKHTVN